MFDVLVYKCLRFECVFVCLCLFVCIFVETVCVFLYVCDVFGYV